MSLLVATMRVGASVSLLIFVGRTSAFCVYNNRSLAQKYFYQLFLTLIMWVLLFFLKAGNSSVAAKLSAFNLKMTVAVKR